MVINDELIQLTNSINHHVNCVYDDIRDMFNTQDYLRKEIEKYKTLLPWADDGIIMDDWVAFVVASEKMVK